MEQKQQEKLKEVLRSLIGKTTCVSSKWVIDMHTLLNEAFSEPMALPEQKQEIIGYVEDVPVFADKEPGETEQECMCHAHFDNSKAPFDPDCKVHGIKEPSETTISTKTTYGKPPNPWKKNNLAEPLSMKLLREAYERGYQKGRNDERETWKKELQKILDDTVAGPENDDFLAAQTMHRGIKSLLS